jgi:hypothetical protein
MDPEWDHRAMFLIRFSLSPCRVQNPGSGNGDPGRRDPLRSLHPAVSYGRITDKKELRTGVI